MGCSGIGYPISQREAFYILKSVGYRNSDTKLRMLRTSKRQFYPQRCQWRIIAVKKAMVFQKNHEEIS